MQLFILCFVLFCFICFVFVLQPKTPAPAGSAQKFMTTYSILAAEASKTHLLTLPQFPESVFSMEVAAIDHSQLAMATAQMTQGGGIALSGQDGSDERVEEMEQQAWQMRHKDQKQQDHILELQRTNQEMQRKHGEEMEQMQKQEQLRLLDDFSRTDGFGTSDDDVRCVIRK